MIKVRKTKNLRFILKLNEQIFPSDPLEPNASSLFWLIYMNDVPVGFASVRGLTHTPDVAFFDRAGLKPIAQGKGLHKRLITIRLRYLRRIGYRCAITYCLDDNFASANNLVACGFKLYEPENRWADSSQKKEVLYFMKDL